MSDILFILSRLDLSSIVDILLVAMVFYWLLTLIQGTQAVQLLRGILILSVLAAIAASAFSTLTAFSWLMDKALPALFVAVPVIFQPELRRALDRVGRTGGILSSTRSSRIERSIEAVTKSVVPMSRLRHGALIVFERSTGLAEHIETGIRLDAVITADLLTTIFFPGAALHDGSVIIRDDRIVAAAVVLPLVKEINNGEKQLLGTRHQAALGITSMTDAVAVVVSEETGLISVAHNGRLIRGLDERRLRQLLKAFHKSQLEGTPGWRQIGQDLLESLGLAKKSMKPQGPPRPQSQPPPKQ